MQIAKVKFVGSSSRFTTNNVYDVVGWNGGSAIVLDDNGDLYGAADTAGSDWSLEYLAVVEVRQLYP